MAAVTVGDILQEAIDDFCRQKDYISFRSYQKGLNYALKGYINNFIVEKCDEKLQHTFPGQAFYHLYKSKGSVTPKAL